MKKILSFCIAMLCACAVMNAAETTLEPGSKVLYNAVAAASAGDVLILTDGVYEEPEVVDLNKNITIKAADGAKPVIAQQYYMRLLNGAQATFIGIKFDGGLYKDGQGANDHCIRPYDDSANKTLTLINCEFCNWKSYILYPQRANRCMQTMTLQGCYFHNNQKGAIYVETGSSDPCPLAELNIENTTFNGTPTYKPVDLKNGGSAVADAKLRIDHCTFYNCGPVRSEQSTDVVISNSIFAAPEATYAATICYGGEIKNCLVYNVNAHQEGPTVTGEIAADPKFKDAANGDFTLADDSPAMTAGTDGKAIGDPRWVPAAPADKRLKGAYKIGGDAADYAKLSDAIAAIEANGMSGDVDLLICADLAENVNIGVTNNSEYTLTIRPDKAEKRTITYGDQADNAGPSGHILVGALMAKDFNTTLGTKNVWLDGSVDGEGQYLEIRAGAVGGRTIVFYGDVTNSGIKNCRIINPRATNTNYAVEIRTEKNTDKRPVGIVIENNYIEDIGSANTQAIQFNGSQSATADGKPKDVVIRNNEIVANLRGIFFNGAENAVIEGNTFRLAKASAGFLAHGIMGNAQKGTIIVRGNKFLELGTMNTDANEYGICGITASGGSDVWVIENNVFAGLDSKADVAGKIVTLRYVRCGDSCVVRNNTFHLPVQTYKPATELVASQAVTCLWLAGAKQYVAENNLFVSEETEAKNSLIRGALNPNVKNNVFFHKGGNAAILAGAVVAADSAAFFSEGANEGSKWAEPKFADAANGDFAIAEYNEDLIVPRSEAVLKDIENKDRRENTYAGAYEGPDKSPGDAIDNIELSEGAQKLFRDGQIYIQRDGKVYTITGTVVR